MRRLKFKLFSYFPHIFGGLALFYFMFHMISGDRGLVSYIRAKNEYKLVKSELSIIKTKNAAIENKIRLLKDDSINYDLLEEEAIKTLGIAKKGDIMLVIKK